MLACFLFAFLVLPAIGATCSLLARRALPLLSGGCAAWSCASTGMGWMAICMISLATIAALSCALDWLVRWWGLRCVVIAAEALAGAGLSGLIGYALLRSSDVHGVDLWASAAAIACLAAMTSVTFRIGEEELNHV